jgi:hypothetical protein
LLNRIARGQIAYVDKYGKSRKAGTPAVARATRTQLQTLFNWYVDEYGSDEFRSPIVKTRKVTRGTIRPCTLRSAMAIIAPAACSNRCRRGGGASRSVVTETALIAMFHPRRPEDSLAPRKMGRGRLNLKRRPS